MRGRGPFLPTFLLVLLVSILLSCTEKRQETANRLPDKPKHTTIMEETPLKDVPGWSVDQVARMGKAWITTAEQVVALSATPGGIRSLSEQIGVSEEKGTQLVNFARAKLRPETKARLDKEVDSSERGLGVLPPKKRS
jgi:hypothetical protein